MRVYCIATPVYSCEKTLNRTNLLSSSEELKRFVRPKMMFTDIMNGPSSPRRRLTRANEDCPMTETERGKVNISGMHLCDDPKKLYPFKPITKAAFVE
jgi:hypothetical protein